MKKANGLKASDVLPVPRTKEEAKHFYDCISRVYDYLIGVFERKYAEMALERLSVQEGETVLEIGFGTGHCLKRIAESVGETGKAYGVDISSGMLEVTRRGLEKAKLIDRVELYRGDAASLSKGNGEPKLLRLYEWVHRKWPKYVDCRPIYVEQSLSDAGYKIRKKEKVKLVGLLPSQIVVAMKAG